MVSCYRSDMRRGSWENHATYMERIMRESCCWHVFTKMPELLVTIVSIAYNPRISSVKKFISLIFVIWSVFQNVSSRRSNAAESVDCYWSLIFLIINNLYTKTLHATGLPSFFRCLMSGNSISSSDHFAPPEVVQPFNIKSEKGYSTWR